MTLADALIYTVVISPRGVWDEFGDWVRVLRFA